MDSLGSEPPVHLSAEDMERARLSIECTFLHIDSSYVVTSKAAQTYNCIAWALGLSDKRWWPSEDDYWPEGLRMGQSVPIFTDMFRLHGFEPCDDFSQEFGFEKIALFTRDKLVKHAARQLESGRWTSKLGKAGFDIAHSSLTDLEGRKYGVATHFLRRKLDRSSIG